MTEKEIINTQYNINVKVRRGVLKQQNGKSMKGMRIVVK